MGASAWCYVEPYAGDIAAALAGVRQREFERLFVRDTYWDDLRPADRPFTSVDELDDLLENEALGEEGTHTIIDVCELIDSDAYDDDRTVRPLSDEESLEIFGTSKPTRKDFDRAQERYRARQPGASELWEMDRWSAWCRPLRDADGVESAIVFWGRSGD